MGATRGIALAWIALALLASAGPSAAYLQGAPGLSLARGASSGGGCGSGRGLRRASPLEIRALATTATDSEFKKVVLESTVPTLVVFWASWCGPCRMLKPVLDEMEQEYEGKIRVVQVNTDENQQAATEYGIRSIPTTMLFKGGQRIDMAIGAVPKATLEAMVLKRL